MRSDRTVLALVVAFTGAVGACARESPPPPGPLPSALQASCSACHLGATKLELAPRQVQARLRAFRSGARPGLVMPRIAHALTDADIDALAAALGTPGAAQ